LTEQESSLVQRITPDRPYILAELRFGVLHEMARTLGDLLIRRSPIAFETRDHGRDASRRVAPRVGEWLGWNAAETERAISAYDAEIARMFTID
jgi:glycerol-3-phosphate dehydrogenase